MAGMPPEPFTEVEFEEATKMVRGNLAATAASEDLLYLYARFKQAKEGPCQAPKPSFYQLTEKSKWSAWSELGALGRAEAMGQYVERVTLLRPGWREEVAREPTEGWVAVSSPVRAEEPAELTVWDLVKEGTLAQLTAVLDSLGSQVQGREGCCWGRET
jgi:acyl-CoA-binding protein